MFSRRCALTEPAQRNGIFTCYLKAWILKKRGGVHYWKDCVSCSSLTTFADMADWIMKHPLVNSPKLPNYWS